MRLRRVVPGAPARLFAAVQVLRPAGLRQGLRPSAGPGRSNLPAGTYDLITWVPVSPKTLRRRGYDQAQLLAQETARALAAQAVPLLEKTRDTPPQSSLTQGRQRRANVAGVYTAPHPAQVAGQRVLLLDDILTTGATLNEAARTLRQAGARQVVAAAFCRTPPKNP